MNWEEKLAVLQSLTPGRQLLRMLGPGSWRCSLPGEVDRLGQREDQPNTVLRCDPAAAVDACFELLALLKTDEAVRIPSGSGISSLYYRWSGACWVQVQR